MAKSGSTKEIMVHLQYIKTQIEKNSSNIGKIFDKLETNSEENEKGFDSIKDRFDRQVENCGTRFKTIEEDINKGKGALATLIGIAGIVGGAIGAFFSKILGKL